MGMTSTEKKLSKKGITVLKGNESKVDKKTDKVVEIVKNVVSEVKNSLPVEQILENAEQIKTETKKARVLTPKFISEVTLIADRAVDPASIFFPSEIDENNVEINPRDDLGTEEQLWLQNDIEKNGVFQSLLVVETGNKEKPYRLFHGKRRLSAIRAVINAGKTIKGDLVPVKIVPVEEATIFNELINHGRLNSGKKLTNLEEGKLYHNLNTMCGKTRKEIAQAMIKTESHVSAMILLHTELPEEIKEEIRDKELSPTTALFAVKKIDNKEALKAVLTEAKSEAKANDPKGKTTQQNVSNAIEKLKVDKKERSEQISNVMKNRKANTIAAMADIPPEKKEKTNLPLADRFKENSPSIVLVDNKEKDSHVVVTTDKNNAIIDAVDVRKGKAPVTYTFISTLPIDQLKEKLNAEDQPTAIEKVIIENMISFLQEDIVLDEMLFNLVEQLTKKADKRPLVTL